MQPTCSSRGFDFWLVLSFMSAWRNLFVPIMDFNWEPEYINRSQQMKVWNLRLAWFLDAYLVVLLTKVFEEGIKLIFIHVAVPVLGEAASIVNINKHRCVTATEETQRHATLPSFPVFSIQTLGTPHAMFSRENLEIRALRIGFAHRVNAMICWVSGCTFGALKK